jgi:Alkylmercury lyase
MDALLRDVRLYIYQQMIETSAAPSAAETAAALSLPQHDVTAAYHALAETRALVLRPNSSTVWMAMPFSNVQTGFTVISSGRAYYANCAFDAFGVAAMLQADSRIFTTCADCGGVLERKISNRQLSDTRGVVHFALPARRWWEDVGFT